MPLYDFQCKRTKHVFEREVEYEERKTQTCKCGGSALQLISVGEGRNYAVFPEGVFEHITSEPLYISDKRELKDACKKHGVIAPFYS